MYDLLIMRLNLQLLTPFLTWSRSIGLSHTPLNWFKLFCFSEPFIQLHSFRFKPSAVTSDVPQGSILGYLYFLVPILRPLPQTQNTSPLLAGVNPIVTPKFHVSVLKIIFTEFDSPQIKLSITLAPFSLAPLLQKASTGSSYLTVSSVCLRHTSIVLTLNPFLSVKTHVSESGTKSNSFCSKLLF